MIAVLDIGNTSIKIAVMDHIQIYELKVSNDSMFQEHFEQALTIYPQIKDVAVCKVGAFNDKHLQYLKDHFKVYEVGLLSELPFTNNYKSSTLGNDRIALVAGALFKLEKPQNTLIIDAGTCVTYDFIDKDHIYHGGSISPGLRLRYESLHNFTDQLPLLKPQRTKKLIGATTDEAIHSGVVIGLSAEIRRIVKKYKKQYENLNILITGGDSALLSKQLKNRYFASPFLMLYGIYYLYTLNRNL